MRTYITFGTDGLLSAFYHDAVHGPRRLLISDPTYQRRQIVVDFSNDAEPVTVDDPTDIPPTVDAGPNPATKIPADAVEITEDQYRELLDNQGRRKVQVIGGEVQISEYTPPPPPLAEVKSSAAATIDAAAGAARARYITIAPGQEATYQLKSEQAATYRDAGYPTDASPWPLINLEAQATGSAARDTADLVLATRDAWVQIAAQIEAARIGGKQAVAQAADVATVDAARDAALAALAVL